ncbi:MAG: ferredoxin--NADP reductase [Candidatus Eisenbacteria bacterium]|nr:ferredoxin--NADP reductase [Candidatus Eisenbacteria bacterium]
MNPYNATLERKEILNQGLVVLRIAPDETPYRFEPGQYTVLGLLGREGRILESEPEDPAAEPEKLIKRAYSLASGSTEEHLEFYIVLVTSGALTPRLLALEEGARLWVSPKAVGMFTLDSVPEDQGVVLVATGTGLAPYISMVRTKIEKECGGKRRWAILHGARQSWDLGYRNELETIRKRCSNFFYLPSITRPSPEDPWGGLAGRVNLILVDGTFEERFGERLDPSRHHVFLCGNPAMVEDAVMQLGERGFSEWHHRKNPQGTIHVERYW